MFYIYDQDGIRFKGPMEALENARRVERRAAVQSLKGGEQTKLFPDEVITQKPTSLAVTAYRQATSHENMVEPLVHIYQIMSNPVTTISADLSLIEAWKVLGESSIRQLVVITERNMVAGVLSDRDILRRINVIDDVVEMELALTARDVMQEQVITTDSMSDIRRVAKVMAFYHVDAMPVTKEDGGLIGIVTRGDILRSFAENPKLNLWA